MDERIIRRAARQHGAFSRQQLLADGVSPDTIRSLVRERRVDRRSNGVYSLRGSPATPEREAMVAALRCGPDAVVIGERMLALVGLPQLRRDGPFEVLTRPGRRLSNVPWTYRDNPSPGRDASTILDIPSVTPARQVLEVAVRADAEQLTRVVDACRWDGRWMRQVQRLATDLPQHPGAIRLLDSGLIAVRAGESPPERVLYPRLRHLGAQRQVTLLGRYRVDLFIPAALLVIEYDGLLHGAPARAAADATRDAELRAAGFAIERLRAADLRDLDALVAHIESIVARRAALLAG